MSEGKRKPHEGYRYLFAEIPVGVRRIVDVYAKRNGITVKEAVAELIKKGAER